MAKPPPLDLALNIRQAVHDLCQPLAAVTGLIDLLLLEMDETDPKLKEVQTVSEQLERVLQLVGEIRQMARQASGAEPHRPEPATPQTQAALGIK
jgi:signal transduction histidine kinase